MSDARCDENGHYLPLDAKQCVCGTWVTKAPTWSVSTAPLPESSDNT